MVRLLLPDNASDDAMRDNAGLVRRAESKLVGRWTFKHESSENHVGVYRAPFPVSGESGYQGIAFWVGELFNGQIPKETRLGAYIAFKPITLVGEPFFEGKYAYTVPEFQRRGLNRRLIRAAVIERPLLSDRFGMRTEAYIALMKVAGVHRQWYDQQNDEFVDDDSVLEQERFCFGDQCARWHIVLRRDMSSDVAIDEATSCFTAPAGEGYPPQRQ
jgi:hypothetical protein